MTEEERNGAGANAYAAAAQLREACANGDVEAARALLAAGASVNASDGKGKTALYFAAKQGDVRVMALLLDDYGAELDTETTKAKTVLHVAASQGGVAAVRFLLERGHAVDVQDEYGRTVLFGAALRTDVETMRVLIEHGVDLDVEDARTALFVGASRGSIEAIQFLLEQGRALGLAIDDGDDDDKTALHYAAEAGHAGTVAFLLKQGASVYAADSYHTTALHEAAMNGHADAVTCLLKHGALVDAEDDAGDSAFDCAVMGARTAAMRVLVEHGADAHAVKEDGRTALHMGAEIRHAEGVALLLELGLAVDALDKNGVSVLHDAATGGDVGIMRCLVEHGADVFATDKGGGTVLHSAARRANLDAVVFLLDCGVAVNAADHDGVSVFHCAVKVGDESTMRALVERGADVHASTKQGDTALHIAVASGSLDTVSFLVSQGLEAGPVTQEGASPFHYAARGGKLDIMTILLDHGADAHAVTHNGWSALHFAADKGHAAAVSFLLEQGLSAAAVDMDGHSVFHLAVKSRVFNAMKALIDHGVDANVTLENGRSALHYAAQSGNLEGVSWLLDQGVAVDSPDANGASAFRVAVENGQAAIMKLLLEHGADAKVLLTNGRSALHYAAIWRSTNIALSLLGHGLAVDAADEDGATAFHLAAETGDVGTMRLLVEHGADAFASTKTQRTALHAAAKSGQGDALDMLLELGLAIDSADNFGCTALHYAAMSPYHRSTRLLIDRGADVHARLKNGKTALHLCATTEAAELLIDRGVAINATDQTGTTALLLARGSMRKFLIEHGADAHVQTKTRQTIVHLAVESQDPDALKYAIELGLDVNTRAKINGAWLSPLAIAFQADDLQKAYKMVLALCTAGAHFDTTDRLAALKVRSSKDAVVAEGQDVTTPSRSTRWRLGLCACVEHWAQELELGASDLTTVPTEIIARGEASVQTYLADVAHSSSEDRLHRCKICVVGPSEWGKTSLVQSLKADSTVLTQLKDRTVGIDLTTCELQSVVDDSPVRLEITFWDFAGQDVYHAAHTLFFSQRTLFVLVVDLDAYWKELADAESKPTRVSEAQMNRFVGAKIFRWVRSIFAHRPDAQFAVVGSKVDKLEDARVVAEIWNDLRDHLDRWKAAFTKGFDHELLPARATTTDIKGLQARLSRLGSSDWLVANIMEVESIRAFRGAIETTVISSELGFPMWKTYTTVLQSVVTRRNAARHAVTARERIEMSIIGFSTLRRHLLREIDQLDRKACEQILRTLGDLGDVLWYEHDGAGVFQDCVILDPMLVIEIVREVVRHDFSSDANLGKPPRDGRITHALLRTFPLWKDMDAELMHAFKALLQHFQLAYPADADTMLPESDIIVPAYWNTGYSFKSASGATATPKSIVPQTSVCDAFAVHRWCWEYEVPSELSDTVFVQFAVQSHSSYLVRTIRGYCVEAACAEFATSISLLQRDSPRDVLRIEVSGTSVDLSWHNMRYYLMKMEKVLEGYPGDTVWRSIVYRAVDSSSESRHPVGLLMKAIEDAIVMGKGTDAAREKMPWMPPDMDWFMRKSWNDIASFQQLRMDQLVQEKLEVLQKLAIVGDAPRQFPALWSLEYVPAEHKALLRMSSDLSGRCFHVPLEIDTGSAVLARHASVFKAGVSLFATVVGNAVSLPIIQNVLDAAKSAFDNNAGRAERVHNLIDKLDLSSQSFDARTTTKLSPTSSMVLLRDLLNAYDDSLDALDISEISNLECAVTAHGEYVWAHAHEIAGMKGEITRCAAPPSAWKELEVSATTLANVAVASPTFTSNTTTISSPGATIKSKSLSKPGFKLSLSVDSVVGLSDWDWHKTYCKWQLYFGRKSLTPLAEDTTPTNADSSCTPSWRTRSSEFESVASVEMLRECRLTVQVKRRSRIGWTKLIGEGEVWLRDFVDEDAAQNFASEPVKVPLGDLIDRAVILNLALVH